jgi:hypothetical protein
VSHVPVPATLADVTASWLTAALRQSGALQEGAAQSVTATPIGAGVGFMSEVARLDVAWSLDTSPPLPERFVIKVATRSEANRRMAMDYGLYAREVRFYRELAPVPGLVTPHTFLAELDEAGGDVAILMEDLTVRDVTDPSGAFDDDELFAITADLAAFHAAWWGDVATRPVPAWIPRLDGPVWSSHQQMFGAAWSAFRAQGGLSPPPPFLAFGELIVRAIPALQRRLSRDPVTLVHFDLRRSNLFVVDDGGPHLAAVDWQPLTVARGAYDVAYFLTQSVATERRRARERDLLAHYLRSLADHGIDGYGEAELWEDYRLGAAYTTSYAVGTVLVDLGNDTGRAYAETVLARAAAAVDDLALADVIAPYAGV